jgi:predicted deacetylase
MAVKQFEKEQGLQMQRFLSHSWVMSSQAEHEDLKNGLRYISFTPSPH